MLVNSIQLIVRTDPVSLPYYIILICVQFQCTNVCFWYVPEALRNQEETDEWREKLSKVTLIYEHCFIL